MPSKKKAAAKKPVKKTAKNDKIKGQFRSAMKKTNEAIKAGNATEAKEWQKRAQKAIDKAVQKKVLKKNTAARKKSRLNKKIKALAQK